ncbi:hypothetical protein D3C73_838830 [compost metagenome]
MLQGADVHFGHGLGAVVGFEPHQVAAPAFLAADPQHGGFVEGLARGQPVGATPVELAVGKAFAHVQSVAVDQETVADHNVLATERQVDAIGAQHREQVRRAPAEVGVFELGGAFRTIAETCGIAVAPGAGAEQIRCAVSSAHTGQALVETQAVLDVALAPRRRTFVETTRQGVVFLAVEHAENRFQRGVQVTVVIGVEFVGSGLASADHQRESRKAKQGGLEHGVASVLVLERRFAVCPDTKSRLFSSLLPVCQLVGRACQIGRFGRSANTTGTQGKTCKPTTTDNPAQPAEAPWCRHLQCWRSSAGERVDFQGRFLCSPPCVCPSLVCCLSPWPRPHWRPIAHRLKAVAPKSSPMNAGFAMP